MEPILSMDCLLSKMNKTLTVANEMETIVMKQEYYVGDLVPVFPGSAAVPTNEFQQITKISYESDT